MADWKIVNKYHMFPLSCKDLLNRLEWQSYFLVDFLGEYYNDNAKLPEM